MTKCEECSKNMGIVSSCISTIKRNGKVYNKIPYVNTYVTKNRSEHRCHDCGVLWNGFHHCGCDMERCPMCGGQMISCECNYTDEENKEFWNILSR